jgi:hypothetical protein
MSLGSGARDRLSLRFFVERLGFRHSCSDSSNLKVVAVLGDDDVPGPELTRSIPLVESLN